MKFLRPDRRLLIPLLHVSAAALLAACANPQPPATQAGQPPPHWTEDTLIQPDQLLPNGLRPLRYFYW